MKLNLDQLVSFFENTLARNSTESSKKFSALSAKWRGQKNEWETSEQIFYNTLRFMFYIAIGPYAVRDEVFIPVECFFPPKKEEDVPDAPKFPRNTLSGSSNPKAVLQHHKEELDKWEKRRDDSVRRGFELPKMQKIYEEDLEHNVSVMKAFFEKIGYKYQGDTLEEVRRIFRELAPCAVVPFE